MNKRHIFPLIAIVAPIVVIASWIGQYALRVQGGKEVTLAIVGFDPRDLLSGHYLQYRIDYGLSIDCANEGPRCLCFTDSEGLFKAVTDNQCDGAQDSCTYHLRGECKNSQFVAGIERFYFPEQYMQNLTIVPPNATIKVRISQDGKGIVTGMEVSGEPYANWIKRQKPEP